MISWQTFFLFSLTFGTKMVFDFWDLITFKKEQKETLINLASVFFFQIHLLEESSTLKISLDHQDGVWCENIVVPELRLLRNATENDHLVISFEQKRKTGSDLTVYFSCVPKGRLHLPYSLREMLQMVKHSKVKVFHGNDLELKVCQCWYQIFFQYSLMNMR